MLYCNAFYMQVEVFTSDSSQPIEFYTTLGDQPLQLSMPNIAGAAGQEFFTPPMLQLNLAACSQNGAGVAVADSSETGAAAAAVASAATSQEQQQPAALASSSGGSSVMQLLAGGNCAFELLGDAGSLLLRVEAKPVGACQRNACRAISLLLGLPKGQGSTG
jgi:hypothetical protein